MHSADIVQGELRGHVRSIVEISTASRKTALSFAAKVLGLPFSRVKKLYYGEPLAVRAHEADQIRAYVEAATALIQARADYEEKRAEYLKAAGSRLARLAPSALDADEVPQSGATAQQAVKPPGRNGGAA
jgi:hypothetical protein